MRAKEEIFKQKQYKKRRQEEKQRLCFERYKRIKVERLDHKNPIKGMKFRKIIRPIMRLCLLVQRKICGLRIELISEYYEKSDKQIVFVVSHIGKWDFEIVNEIIKDHFYIIAADFMHMHGNLAGFFMNAFGVIYIDEQDKEDRANSKKMMEAVLRQSDNIMIFPEGAWNLSENELIYDLAFGCVEVALNTDSVIIPICLEQYGKRFVINIGKQYIPTDLVTSIQELRDIMATLKYEIWQHEGIIKRNSITYDYWHKFLKERIGEWHGYDMHDQLINTWLPHKKREYFEILHDMRRLKITEKNSFLIMDKEKYIQFLKTKEI